MVGTQGGQRLPGCLMGSFLELPGEAEEGVRLPGGPGGSASIQLMPLDPGEGGARAVGSGVGGGVGLLSNANV